MGDARIPADPTLSNVGIAGNAQTAKPLAELYAEHVGKVSDKWSAYFRDYDRIFEGWRAKPVRILEIGVQNGGSLEIWAKAFPNGRKFVGCDINPDCANLSYDDPRVVLVVGDANADATETAVLENAPTLDIIIDDGSHRSGDIIKSFARYFPHLASEGVYIVEDLHCSYWQEFEGGLYFPFSAMAFFKRLADIINHEHWKIAKSHSDVLKGFFAKYDCRLTDEHLTAIHSVAFTNSVCVIRKDTARHHGLGARAIAGQVEVVYPGTRQSVHARPGTDQTENEWTARSMPPEEELPLRLGELAERASQIAGLQRAAAERDGEIAALNRAASARDARVEALCRAVGERDARIAALHRAVAEQEARVAALSRTVGERDDRIADLGRQASERSGEFAALNRIVADREADIADLKQMAEDRNQQIAALNRTLDDQTKQLAALYASTSWRLTAPLRFGRLAPRALFAEIRAHISRTARAAYRRAPLPASMKLRIKHALFRNAAPLFRHTTAYRDWQSLRHQGQTPGQHALDALRVVPHRRSTDANLFARYARNAVGGSTAEEFVPLSPQKTSAERCDVKLVAYYLPQFHPTPENDEWWGKGFTEWRNVTRAFPVFDEHYQPRIPGELGYYDLRLIDNIRRQVELAKHHGIAAFCFHFYWFGGKRLLELPIDIFLRNKDLDLQFSLCWANENWSRRWDGGDNEVLIAQSHSAADDVAFIRYLYKYFQDSRYIRVDGRPMLTVYRPATIPNIKETIARWRQEALRMGLPGLYLIATNALGFVDHVECGFDALSEFPPHSTQPRQIHDNELKLASVRKGGIIYSYPSIVDYELNKAHPVGTVHPGIMPSWDNSARRPFDGHIYHDATPALFTRWLQRCLERARRHRRPERFVFINAWNEWAEGAYLEPDRRYGYAYLAACAAVVGDQSRPLISSSSPKVSAIVPNYNHARFFRERFASIVEQRLPVSEIIILDDASTDDSRDVIARIAAGSSIPVRTVFNDTNSGSVFSQWAKGITLAEGDLIWICESDDTCDRGFLEALVPYFQDQSVMLAFGWIDFIEEDGSPRPGMDNYMEGAAPGEYWQAPRIESAYRWFQGPFGIRNVIPNVAGCLFRRQHISAEVWAELTSYKVCGDWYLYSRLAHRGRIAYDPSARAYFRQHRGNTSVSSFKTKSFHEEHIRIAFALRRHYGSGAETLRKMLRHTCEHYHSVFGDAAARDFARRHPLERVLAQGRTIPHVLVAMYAFQTGGGEVFPILLANEISRRGYDVSVLVSESERVNEQMRRLLAPEIPVFTTAFVEKMGVRHFFDEFSVDLIHTHNVGIDMWLHWQCKTIRTPYIVTHHGSYECVPMTEELTKWLLANVDHWVYIADKNLAFMNGRARDARAFTKLPNAMPRMEGEFPISRQDLGIEPDAFVFGLASRAIHAKGWDIAVHALKAVRRETARPVHLVLCGDGEDLDSLKAAHCDVPGVHFLGYQEKIQAFYRWCDCCILPTRFAGESYPLTIIEAILAGIPAIATDVGEIRSMLNIDREPMGIVVPPNDSDAVFGEGIGEAMRRLLDHRTHETLRSSVMKNRNMFSMDRLVDDYMAIYQRVLGSATGAMRADRNVREAFGRS